MTRLGLATALLVPVIMAGCQRTPPPPPAPILSAGEAACAAQAAQLSGVDPATVVVTPTSSTKTGATIYTVTAGASSYTCVVEIDNSISTFEVVEL